MLVIPGDRGRMTCDGLTRREILRIGGSAILGLSLPQVLRLQALRAAEATAATTPPTAARKVELEAATADFSQAEYGVAAALDGKPETAWALLNSPAFLFNR